MFVDSSQISTYQNEQARHQLRLIRLNQVQQKTGLSRSYIYDLVKRGLFPKSVPLVPGGTSRAWNEAEVNMWIEERISQRDQEVAND